MNKNIIKYFLEFLGTLILLLTIVGSGIMGANLSNNESVTLIANAISIGLILFVLISSFRSISGAHFNPAVTIMLVLLKKMKFQDGIVYIFLQITGACLGVIFANYLFGLDAIQQAALDGLMNCPFCTYESQGGLPALLNHLRRQHPDRGPQWEGCEQLFQDSGAWVCPACAQPFLSRRSQHPYGRPL